MMVLGACMSPLHSTAVDLREDEWTSRTEIRVANDDTLSLMTMQLFFRTNHLFNQDSLTVKIATTTPDSLHMKETFLVEISREDHTAALKKEYVVDYRHKVRLAKEGIYRFEITPTRKVQGVEAIGINFIK